MTDEERYAAAASSRQEYIDRILSSDARRKVVVAGPGTGKTYLFKKVLDGKNNTLTLSFVNALVNDLALELCGISEVRTLHSYACRELRKSTRHRVALFPKLAQIIREDTKTLIGSEVDFEAIFHNRDDENEFLEFYRVRRRYYDHYGHSDVMYAAAKYFEKNPDRVPTYEQIVVDEFQDFNRLEVSLIELLADKSPMLLAGDDDQALYDFKNASAEHIRHCHGGADSHYEAFSLPYCARCTRVIVDATNDMIAAAHGRGLLNGRIDKPYLYFEQRAKDAECSMYPRLIYRHAYAAQLPWQIQHEIESVAWDLRSSFSVLIIVPTTGQCRAVTKSLRRKGFESVSHVERERPEPTLLDGLKLLLEEKDCNLGWRIVARCLLDDENFAVALNAGGVDLPFPKVLDKAIVQQVRAMLTKLRHVRDQKVTKPDLRLLLDDLEIDPYEPAKASLQQSLGERDGAAAASVRRIPITVTTIQSSKGLAADLVVIGYFDDQYFIRHKDKTIVSDQDVCNFIVALTRARKKVVLISSSKIEPTFLGWIDPRRIQRT